MTINLSISVALFAVLAIILEALNTGHNLHSIAVLSNVCIIASIFSLVVLGHHALFGNSQSK